MTPPLPRRRTRCDGQVDDLQTPLVVSLIAPSYMSFCLGKSLMSLEALPSCLLCSLTALETLMSYGAASSFRLSPSQSSINSGMPPSGSANPNASSPGSTFAHLGPKPISGLHRVLAMLLALYLALTANA